MIPLSDVENEKDNKVVILCTGTQGEPMASLSRIAQNIHKHTKIKEGDTVIISANIDLLEMKKQFQKYK